METSDQKRKPGAKGPTAAQGPAGAPGGKKEKFRLPPGYEAAYLGAGKTFSTEEVDFAELRKSGEIEKDGADDPELVKAYGAWLWDEEGLAELVGKEDKPLAPPLKKQALEKLAKLTPFDREALDRFFGSLGVVERFTRTLGPEGLAQLGKAAQPPPEHKEEQKDEQKDGEKKDEAQADSAEGEKPDDKKPESKNRFQGGTLFTKLFKTPLEKKKVDDPQPILAQLEALDEPAFDEVARTIGVEQAWEPLLQVLGPRFSDVVARQRYQPLRRVLAQFPDGVCDPGERTLVLQQLARLTPFEQRFLQALVQQQGTGNALANLLGPELQLWLSGGALIADKREPDEEPEAALAAARELSAPVQRRLADLITAGAVGPALLEPLASEAERFVQGYWDAVTRPDPEQRQSPKLPLRALAKVNAAQLRLLAWCAERQGQEPASLDAGQGATQFDALLRPLLGGAAPSPEAKKKTLDALRSLSLMELRELLTQLSSDGIAALEALLGDGFGRLVGERSYQPLKDALALGDDELPEAEKQKWLSRLKDLDAWSLGRLQAQVAEEASGPRLAACFGTALKQLGLDELAAKNARPLQKPRWMPTGAQRKKLLAALKKASAASFAALLQGARPGALQRFATAAAAGFDEELGRALLKHLPAEQTEEPADPSADEADLRAFCERVISDERARADDPAPNQPDGEAPRKRKKDEEESPLVDDFDILALYEKLLVPNLDKAAQPEVAMAEFLALPPRVQQALGQHVRTLGTYERFVARLGLEFSRATSEEAKPPPAESKEEDE